MLIFTDLLDDYILTLGEFNVAYSSYIKDRLLNGKKYRDAEANLMEAKKKLNNFFYEEELSNDEIINNIK